jgi:hypothetical protein
MKVRAHAAMSAKGPLAPFEYDLGPLGAQQVDVRVTHCGICLADRAQFFRDIPSGPFYGFNRPGAKVSQGIIDNWWRQGMMCGSRRRTIAARRSARPISPRI